MKKFFNIKNVKKSNFKRYIMDILFVTIFIYIIYAIYLLLRTPTDTFTIERGTLTQEESCVRSNNKRGNCNKR